jgi:hypothetical protein
MGPSEAGTVLQKTCSNLPYGSVDRRERTVEDGIHRTRNIRENIPLLEARTKQGVRDGTADQRGMECPRRHVHGLNLSDRCILKYQTIFSAFMDHVFLSVHNVKVASEFSVMASSAAAPAKCSYRVSFLQLRHSFLWTHLVAPFFVPWSALWYIWKQHHPCCF